MRLTPLWLVLLLVLSSCASSQGFDREAMRALIASFPEAAPHGTVGPPPLDMQQSMQLSVPFRLALYFIPTSFPAHQTLRPAEWVSADRELLAAWLAPLQQEQILSGTLVLMDPTIRGADVRAIRQAADRHGADVLLMVDGMGSVDRYNNGYAALYPTLVGAYLAPGTHSDALFIVNGTLLDVRSDWREASETVEGTAQTVGPAMAVEDRQVLARAKKAALDELGTRMAAALRRLQSQTGNH